MRLSDVDPTAAFLLALSFIIILRPCRLMRPLTPLLDSMTWTKPVATGTCPGIRAGHTMTAVGTKLFVFGGGDGNNYLNDLHILDTGACDTLEVWR